MPQWLLCLGLIVAVRPAALPPAAQAQAASPGQPATDVRSKAALTAATPNPFANRTRFSLTVQKTQPVTVDVFNVLGQRVRTLYEGTMSAGQTRTFVLRAGTLPGGLYLYRAQGEDFVITRRVMLVA